jgi:hypothetical protein
MDSFQPKESKYKTRFNRNDLQISIENLSVPSLHKNSSYTKQIKSPIFKDLSDELL